MYRSSNDSGISQANGIFGLMFGVFYLAISIYVFTSFDADIGVFMVAMALLGIMYNGYKVFLSRPEAEEEVELAKEEDPSPEVKLLMLDSLKADGYINEKEYKAKRRAIIGKGGKRRRTRHKTLIE